MRLKIKIKCTCGGEAVLFCGDPEEWVRGEHVVCEYVWCPECCNDLCEYDIVLAKEGD